MVLPREGRAKPSHPVNPGDTNENEGPRPSFSGAKGLVKAPEMKGLWKNGIKYVRGNRSLQEPKNGSPHPLQESYMRWAKAVGLPASSPAKRNMLLSVMPAFSWLKMCFSQPLLFSSAHPACFVCSDWHCIPPHGSPPWGQTNGRGRLD